MLNCIRSQNSKGQFPKLYEQFRVLNQSVKIVDNTQNQCSINCIGVNKYLGGNRVARLNSHQS